MNGNAPFNGFTAATTVLKWLRTWYGNGMPEAIDLEIVRQILPDTPYGKGVRTIKAPMELDVNGCEGMLVCNPNDPGEWGIFYNGKASHERRRFTIAHELGHFVLHRAQKNRFNCDKESIYSGIDTMRAIECDADEFASNLLMPGDVLRDALSGQSIDLRCLSNLASRFDVSFEALCIRFIKYTDQRAILLYWDNGFLKYEWRSKQAKLTRARIHRIDDPQEPPANTLAAEAEIPNEWDGIEMPASLWCAGQGEKIMLREFKHSYAAGNRVLTLLLLEAAEPRSWDKSWHDEETTDSFDQFVSNGQLSVR